MGVPALQLTWGVPETINNEKNGLIVHAQNSQELEKALLRLLSDTYFKRELGRKAVETVKVKYDICCVLNMLQKLYENMNL